MDFLPRLAAGMVFAIDPAAAPSTPVFTGSCGAYLRRDVFLTAAHCAPPDRDLLIVTGAGGDPRVVRRRAYHPRSDLALLVTDPPPADQQEFMSNQVYQRPERVLIDGGDFVCFGYPAEGGLDNRPTGRTIRGYCQRWFSYLDAAGRRYFALER